VGYGCLGVGLADWIHSTGQLEPWTKHCKSVSFIMSSCPLLLRMHTTWRLSNQKIGLIWSAGLKRMISSFRNFLGRIECNISHSFPAFIPPFYSLPFPFFFFLFSLFLLLSSFLPFLSPSFYKQQKLVGAQYQFTCLLTQLLLQDAQPSCVQCQL